MIAKDEAIANEDTTSNRTILEMEKRMKSQLEQEVKKMKRELHDQFTSMQDRIEFLTVNLGIPTADSD